jgi:Mn-dependent DtxR family transcriptional regulator
VRKPVAKVIKIRKISKEQAKKEIVQFIKNRKEADTFDIANELRLDMDLTVKALRELWEEGRVK